jgi:drug/metabolite transporter (DMT)-like permease
MLAAVLFSTGGAAIKLVGVGGWQVTAFRALVAFTTLLVLIPESRRGWTWRTSLVAVGYAATTICYVLSNTLTTAANAIFIQNTYPVFILACAPWLLREPVTRRDLAQLAAMVVGMSLFFSAVSAPSRTAPQPLLGNVVALGTAVAWGATVMGYRWLAVRHGGGRAAVAAAAVQGNLLACIVALAVALPLERGTPGDWLTIGYLGAVQLGLPYLFLTRAIPHVTALQASLLLLVEPVLNPVWAWLVHGERPGAAIILGAAAGRAWWDSAQRAARAAPDAHRPLNLGSSDRWRRTNSS